MWARTSALAGWAKRAGRRTAVSALLAGGLGVLAGTPIWWILATPASAAPAAVKVAVRLTPSSIPADGASQTVATATVRRGASPAPRQHIAFTSSDPGQTISAVTNHHNGTYTATITSSTTVGKITITARDVSVHPSPAAKTSLIQTRPPTISTTTVVATSPSSAVTNQLVTLIATVTTSRSNTSPSGFLTFNNGTAPIAGCTDIPVSTPQQSAIITCPASFAAPAGPEQIQAVFTPGEGSRVRGSASSSLNLSVGQDSTSTSLQVSSSHPTAGAVTTYTSTVTPSEPGPVTPSGSVAFLDRGRPIAACAGVPLTQGVASCSVKYGASGAHQIIARYSGDASFTGSTSSLAAVTVGRLVLGTISSTMQWTFSFTRTYTKVLALQVVGARIGLTVTARCSGRGCAFKHYAKLLKKSTRCKSGKAHGCRPPHTVTVSLAGRFRNRRLAIGTQIAIRLTQPNWIGKYYSFTVRPGRAPLVQIQCLAPGASRPGVGC